MVKVRVWHNPRCSKSRAALAILAEAGVDYQVREYLVDVPSAAEIKDVLARLGMSAGELVRRGEAAFAGLEGAGDDELVEAMTKHPILIERPIVIADERAVVGRPPERVRELL